jgi:hypothetical protein
MSGQEIEGHLIVDFSRHRSVTIDGVVIHSGNLHLDNPKGEAMAITVTAGRV